MNEIYQQKMERYSEEYVFENCEREGEVFLVKDAYQKGWHDALQNQWISVDEALPECDRCHLAMYEDGGIIVAKYENETWWWQDGFVVGRNTDGDLMYSSSCKVPSGLITHWMPIPQIGGEK